MLRRDKEVQFIFLLRVGQAGSPNAHGRHPVGPLKRHYVYSTPE